ncbi:MAG: bifunctional alpha,alpha-trehalose-phosphate synthase (UDP-forming)/trehalose-phosphatase [Pedobacter sp.]|jgi:trehalose 6-phosphate synthase/phosphatase|uniref:bifunctional alpha,alpha-trehalose-phosphate synthase (UDP-forming)/trehalose-phosphatase n=1 Tax=Pedobacter sp. TaxID=1411316 RepID=UPI0035614E09
MNKRLIVVSNRLPLTIENTDQGFYTRPSSGGLISAVDAYLNTAGKDVFSEKIWVGMPGSSEEVWDGLDLAESSTYQYLPVFIDDETYDQYYNGFSNSVLWPLFHYFPSFAEYTTLFFDAYIKANEQFYEVLVASIKPDDVIWIHDYHLLPLAAMLRKRFPNLTIGLFLHIPFPSYELFRVIPKKWQKEILNGMLGADLIGFHTSDYVSHFLKTVEMTMNIERNGQYLDWKNRRLKVDAFPISIDFELFDSALSSPDVQLLREKYLSIKGEKKMLFSVDRLDYTKGIYNRLEAYEKFILDNPQYKGNVVFVLVVVPSRDTIVKYNERKRIIDEYIGNINSTLGEIGWQPIIYQYGHLEFSELLALYTTCDLALITPLRDGMNLVAKEFVASRSDFRGVLVLSEMAGAAAELSETLLINPNDRDEIAEAIKNGLEMDEREQETRLRQMRSRIKQYDVRAWAIDYFSEMEAVKSQQLKFEVKFMDSFLKANLLTSYANAKKRLMLIDYDGTLVPFSKEPQMAFPSEGLLKVLSRVSELENNDLYIISGRDSETLGQWLGTLNIGLIAEHGAKVREPNGDWKSEIGIEASEWQDKIYKIMERYVTKSPNSFIEMKEYSLAWHYRKADGFLSTKKAADLYEELLSHTLHLPLDVIDGNKVIEVRNHGINKGKAVETKLAEQDYDFILCVGDDKTDEDMFGVLANVPHAYTIKVGHQASFAKYNLHTPYLVVDLLESICLYPKNV